MSFVYERDNTQAAGELRHQSDGDEKKLEFLNFWSPSTSADFFSSHFSKKIHQVPARIQYSPFIDICYAINAPQPLDNLHPLFFC